MTRLRTSLLAMPMNDTQWENILGRRVDESFQETSQHIAQGM